MSGQTTNAGARENGKRADLIRIGVEIFTEKGFYNTPLDELVKAAGVPKGSFYYYFENKDKYTLEVIQAYAQYFASKLDRILTDESKPPFERITAFTQEAAAGMERYDFKRGCLIGNLSQELAALDNTFRVALLDVLQDWRKRIQLCLDEAKSLGQLKKGVNTEALARYFWTTWEGAVLCAKLEKSRAPLDFAGATFIEQLKHLQPEPKAQATKQRAGVPRTSTSVRKK